MRIRQAFRYSSSWAIGLLARAVILLIPLALSCSSLNGGSPSVATTLEKGARCEDVWFTESGAAVSLRSEKGIIHLKRWDLAVSGEKKPTQKALDLSAVLSPGVDLLYTRGGAPRPQSANKYAPYSVNQGGDLVALATAGNIQVISIDRGQVVASMELAAGHSVAALSFARNGTVVLLLDDGRLRIWDYEKPEKGLDGTQLSSRWAIWSRNELFLASSFETGDIAYIDLREAKLQIKFRQLGDANNFTAAASGIEGIAIGDSEGEIKFIGLGAARSSSGRSVGGRVRALVFAGDLGIVVGGDFSGLFAVDNQRVSQVSSTPVNVWALDYFEGRILYASDQSIGVIALRSSEDGFL